jgi:hypothetical protein
MGVGVRPDKARDLHPFATDLADEVGQDGEGGDRCSFSAARAGMALMARSRARQRMRRAGIKGPG